MSYILIQNAGELPIWGMRLLGLSNKTEDQIGRFGTGLKESIALLARLGHLPIIYSGSCKISFSIKELDGQQEICFKLSEKRGQFASRRWHGLGMHPNFGHSDWSDPWMVFREVMCNALDESGIDNLYHDVVSTRPEGISGATRVYIPVTHELLAAYTSVHDKILQLGKRPAKQETNRGTVLIKIDKHPNLQIFHRGVWVQESPKTSLYDYDIRHLALNESRSSDWYEVNKQIAKMLVEFTQEQVKKLLLAVIKDGEEPYETEVLHSASYIASPNNALHWRLAFEEIWGEDAVICDNDKFFYDRLDKAGKQPVVVKHSGLMDMMKAVGVKHASDVLSHDQKHYEVMQNPSEAQQKVFDDVWARLEFAGLTGNKQKPGLMVFKQRPGMSTVIFGEYRNGICHINMDCGGSAQERLACLEEIIHHVTESRDQSKELQNWLIETLDVLLMNKEFYEKQVA